MTIQVLTIISGSNGNQAMKFFFKNHTQNGVENLFRDPFLKNRN